MLLEFGVETVEVTGSSVRAREAQALPLNRFIRLEFQHLDCWTRLHQWCKSSPREWSEGLRVTGQWTTLITVRVQVCVDRSTSGPFVECGSGFGCCSIGSAARKSRLAHEQWHFVNMWHICLLVDLIETVKVFVVKGLFQSVGRRCTSSWGRVFFMVDC